MPIITNHETNPANRAIIITADEPDPANGNASHEYEVTWEKGAKGIIIQFQHGPVNVDGNGVNGVTNEALLAIVIDRLRGFQSSKYANEYNERALSHCVQALAESKARTSEREARGVEGTHTV